VSSISQLVPVATVPLSRVNDYLASVTGITLNYNVPVNKDSPKYRKGATPSSRASSTDTNSVSSHLDLKNRGGSTSPQKDSSEFF